jgi:Flp pilus assembly pilin Flp
MTMFLLGAGSALVLAGLLYWAWSEEGTTVEAKLLTDEAALKAYLSNLETELTTEYDNVSAALKTEADALTVKGLTTSAAGLTEVLATIQAELAKLS